MLKYICCSEDNFTNKINLLRLVFDGVYKDIASGTIYKLESLDKQMCEPLIFEDKIICPLWLVINLGNHNGRIRVNKSYDNDQRAYVIYHINSDGELHNVNGNAIEYSSNIKKIDLAHRDTKFINGLDLSIVDEHLLQQLPSDIAKKVLFNLNLTKK